MTRLSAIRPANTDDMTAREEYSSSLLVSPKTLASRPDSTSSQGGNTGIGAISIFALIVILCLAVLSVLTIATAHSSLVLAQRQATATHELYLDETAAQTFVSGLDRILAVSDGDAAAAVGRQLEDLCADAEAATDGTISATAHMSDQVVRAEFAGENGRILKIALTILPDGTYRVDSWRMAAVVNAEQPMGTLYLG